MNLHIEILRSPKNIGLGEINYHFFKIKRFFNSLISYNCNLKLYLYIGSYLINYF